MSDTLLKNGNALVISHVASDSPADRGGVQPGDLLRSINSNPILDILDYRFHAAAADLQMFIERNQETIKVRISKDIDEDAGIDFESDLADRIHTCKNKCVFCFIHQQPKKMRKSLYLMDDDFRLSFMHGNYVTLTNLTDEEWRRILEQRLSPLYVSVHATDPDLRAALLGRKQPTPILPQIREMANYCIDIHAQIVLCPDLNDGEALDHTLEDLLLEHPIITGKRAGVQSVAIVPVGLTRFRERLPDLKHVERDYARRMIEHVNRLAGKFHDRIGTRFAWLADEWYYIAEQPYPPGAHYEDFPQLEDGIGTVRLFLDSAHRIYRRLPRKVSVPINATLVTAEMPAPHLKTLANRFNQVSGVNINVCVVENRFFGGDIHIAGLLTAQDIIAQLREFKERNETVFIPAICLRDNDVFLDDITVESARKISGMDIRVVGNTPLELAKVLGLVSSNRISNSISSRWLMEEN